MQLHQKGSLVNAAHKSADLMRKLERLNLDDQHIALMNRRLSIRDTIRSTLTGNTQPEKLDDLQRELVEVKQKEQAIEEQLQRLDEPATEENEETRKFREQFNAIDSWQAAVSQNGVTGDPTFQKIAWVSGYAHKVLAEAIDKDVATIRSFQRANESDATSEEQNAGNRQRLRDAEKRVQHSIRLYDDIQEFILSMYHS